MIDVKDIVIRRMIKGDAAGVRKLLKQSWQKAYSSFIPQSDLDNYLDTTYSEQLLREICENPDFICYVSEYRDLICGWLKLSIDNDEKRFYLSSIYVLPEFQGLKIGERLFHVSCDEAFTNNFDEIYIGVMKQNEKALRWYINLGFNFFEERPFTMGMTSLPHLIGNLILNKKF